MLPSSRRKAQPAAVMASCRMSSITRDWLNTSVRWPYSTVHAMKVDRLAVKLSHYHRIVVHQQDAFSQATPAAAFSSMSYSIERSPWRKHLTWATSCERSSITKRVLHEESTSACSKSHMTCCYLRTGMADRSLCS